MVALLRLLEHLEVVVQLGLVLERRAVDALELRVSFVALVVRAGDVVSLNAPMWPVRITCGPAQRSVKSPLR